MFRNAEKWDIYRHYKNNDLYQVENTDLKVQINGEWEQGIAYRSISNPTGDLYVRGVSDFHAARNQKLKFEHMMFPSKLARQTEGRVLKPEQPFPVISSEDVGLAVAAYTELYGNIYDPDYLNELLIKAGKLKSVVEHRFAFKEFDPKESYPAYILFGVTEITLIPAFFINDLPNLTDRLVSQRRSETHIALLNSRPFS